MFNIYFEVEKNRLRMVSEEDIIAGTKNYLNANFKFSPEWDGMAKTVMFKHNGIEKPKLLVDSERTLIPWEVVQAGGFTVQVYGMRNGQIVASSSVRTDMQTDEIPVMVSGGYVANTTIEPPTPDIYEQIIDYLIDCINQSEFLQGNGIKRMWMDEDNILHLEKENGEILDFPDMEGDSAYDIAVQLGFVGTEQEWIDSLHYDHSDEFVALAAQVARDALASADSASKAKQSQELAKQSEDNARTSADEASESSVNAKTSEDNALTYSNNAKTSETKAKTSETNALTHAGNASNSATASATSAKLSQSYAVGGTNSRAGEDTDNSKYYSEQAKASADKAKASADKAKTSEDNAKTSEENAAQSALLVANKEDFATIKADPIAEITNEATLRTYFYNQRKSTSRKWQFEISTGSNENIMAGLGGYPDSYSASDKAFVYIELPFSEAGGFIIKATYEGRNNGALYKQTIFGTLDSNWHTTGWIKIAKNETEVFNVTIEDDGFGNYTCSHNDNDINNARNAGKVVQAKHDSGTQTFTYYYSTMESDRRPTFIRTYIEDGVAKQVLISVGYDKKVTVERRVADKIVVDAEMSDVSENPVQNKVVKKYAENTFAPVIVNGKSGSVVAIDDISPIPQTVPVKVESNNLIPSLKTPTDSRITISENGEIVVSGTFNATYFTNFGDVELEAGTYYISTNTHKGIDLYTEIDGQQVINKSFTLSVKTRLTILIRVTDGVYNQVKCNIMLNKGTSSLPYTKHVDVTQSKVKALGNALVPFEERYSAIDSLRRVFSVKDYPYLKNVKSIALQETLFLSKSDGRTSPRASLTVTYTDGTAFENSNYYEEKGVEQSLLVTAEIEKPLDNILIRLSDYGINETAVFDGYVKNAILSIAPCKYEPYKGKEYPVSTDGTVVGVQSISPNMTLMSDTEGVTINTAYKADTKKYIDNKFKELESKITNTQALALEL